jgi:hypothetical protein
LLREEGEVDCMKTVSGKSGITIAFLLLFLAALLPGCGGGKPSEPINAQLSFSEPPILDKTVQVTATFNLEIDYQDAYNITTRIILSEGFERVDGDLEWKGDIIRGNTYTLNARIKAIKTGTWKIAAQAFSGRSDGMGGYRELWVTVTENSATISDTPPTSEGRQPLVPLNPQTPDNGPTSSP